MTAANYLHLALACFLFFVAALGIGTLAKMFCDAFDRWLFHRRMRAIVRNGPGVRAVRLAVWKRWIHRL